MLAGRMKLKYFLAIVVVVVAAGIFGLVKACKSSDPPPRPEDLVARPTPTSRPPDPTPTPTPRSTDELSPRPHDAEVLAWRTRSVSAGKGKDVSKGKPYKINVYQDPGHAKANRAKVDVNRNDKWDEKYSFDEDGTITLQIAPADDESYTRTYHWTGTAWLPEGASVEPATATPPAPDPTAAKVDLPARGYDAEVLAWKERSVPGGKGKDVSKGRPYKINVYQDAGNSKVNRAKVDVNRNDKWDEKYTFESTKITLQRAPADDEQYTETYHWVGGGWVKK